MTEKKKATEATFGTAPKRFSIASLDEKDKADFTVHAQFNPKELSIDQPVPWGDPGDAGGGNGASRKGGVEKQFTGAKGRALTVELLFDDTDIDKTRNGDIARNLKILETLATVRDPKHQEENMRRPHWCVAILPGALPRFECVIEQMTTKYELISPSGKPLRVRCTLKLAEATRVSIKDKNKPKKPATPASGGPAPAGATGSGTPTGGGSSPTGGGGAPSGGGGAPSGGSGAPSGGSGAPSGGSGAPTGGSAPRPNTPPARP